MSEREPRILTILHFINEGSNRPLNPASGELTKFWLALTEPERIQFSCEVALLQQGK
jgi:hypothetical protein